MLRARTSSRAQAGFTLVEVMVAMSVLLVGVLGTVTMVDGANQLTSRNKAREGATALGRSVLEIARGIPYKQLTAANLTTELDARAGFKDVKPGITGHQVLSEGYTYTVTPTICAMDDPADKLGSHTGSVVPFCSDSDSTTTPSDRNADDYRRVSLQVAWTPSVDRTEATTQRAVVTNPVGGLGPSVTALDPSDPKTQTITSAITEAKYSVTTSTVADGVVWTVNGAKRADAVPGTSDLNWSFTWELGHPDTPIYYDCSYVLQAEAFDGDSRAGAAKALTVTLNRRQPFAPPSFVAGRNLNGNLVDVSWARNRECDVKGYRVYRGPSAGSTTELVCSRDIGEPTECIDDPGPSATFPLYYRVVAVDTSPSNIDREGDSSATVEVTDDNASPPAAPAVIVVCGGGNPDCNDIDGEPAPPGTAVLTWEPSTDPDGDQIAYYRIYRDGTTYDERHAIMIPVTDKPLVFVDASVTGSHTYRISAVDEHLGESALSEPVTWP